MGIAFAEFEDQTKATIVQNEIQIGSITAYASLQDLFETLKITIAEDVANNVDIRFVLTAWSGPDQEYMSEPTEIVINIKNSIFLSGVVNYDLTLEADKEYLVIENLVLSEDATMIIEPGVILKISDEKKILLKDNSRLLAIGNKDNNIIFMAENNYWLGFDFASDNDNESILDFTVIQSVVVNNSTFSNIFRTGNNSSAQNIHISNSIISDCYGGINDAMMRFNYNNSLIVNSNFVENTYWEFTGTNGTNPQNRQGLNVINNFVFLNNIGRSGIQLSNSNDSATWPMLNTFNNSYSFVCVGDGTTSPENAYLGTSNNSNYLREILDATNSPDYAGVFNTNDISNTPHEEAHGIVWKVEVNGYDAQDEYASLDPLGVGTHEFKVYFNREMDTTVAPQISYGVTIPYNQKIISEQGTWSSDGKIYTVTHEVNIGAADGINRIRVQDAQDLDYFKIPVEDSRFNFLLQSAGSASTGFFAAGGLGKIDLEWVAPSADELDDVLGYNMYRYQIDADGVESEPEKLNETLIIEDTDASTTGVYFSDYAVLEGETYFYKYKILRTSFEETDYSNTVSSSPLTSTLGDSNGDFDVNVLDLVHDVDYILGNNPEPFIFVAGDVNADNTINVLDIVGTVDIIFNGDGGDTGSGSLDPNFYPSQAIGFADFSWEGNDLYVESMHNIGGLQLAFDADFEYVLHELPGIERLDYTQDQLKVLMLYSFNNTTIASTRTKLLTRVDATQDININLAVAGTTTGAKLTPRFKDIELAGIASPFQSSELEFLNLFPNPTSGEVTLMYYLPEQMDGAVAKVYDMLGRLVWAQAIDKKQGMQQANLNLNTLQKGNYIVLISAHKNGGTKNIANKTLIIK